jgi:hypothetical protein
MTDILMRMTDTILMSLCPLDRNQFSTALSCIIHTITIRECVLTVQKM